MASITHSGDFDLCGARTAPVAIGIGGKLKKLARGLTHALEAQRRSEVDREIARLLAQSGGRLTDSLEREIDRRFSRLTGACRSSGVQRETLIARVSDGSCAYARPFR